MTFNMWAVPRKPTFNMWAVPMKESHCLEGRARTTSPVCDGMHVKTALKELPKDVNNLNSSLN